jgi:hypothetical protein
MSKQKTYGVIDSIEPIQCNHIEQDQSVNIDRMIT